MSNRPVRTWSIWAGTSLALLLLPLWIRFFSTAHTPDLTSPAYFCELAALWCAVAACFSSRETPNALRWLWLGVFIPAAVLPLPSIGRSLGEYSEFSVPGFAFVAAATIYVGWRRRGNPGVLRWLADIAIGSVIAVCLVWGIWFWLESRADSMEAQARKKWASIGLPLDNFDQHKFDRQANEQLETLAKNLNFLGVKRLTRPRSHEYEGSGKGSLLVSIADSKAAQEVWTNIRGDQVDLGDKSFPELAKNSDALLELYRATTSAVPPRWPANLSEGFDGPQPEYVTLRRLAILVEADAHRRLAAGDVAGARAALEFLDAISVDLVESPSVVSFMVGMAIRKVNCHGWSHLPPQPNSWNGLETQFHKYRANFYRTAQREGWENLGGLKIPKNKPERLIDQLDTVLEWPRARIWMARGSLEIADIAQVLSDPEVLKSPDLGAERVSKMLEEASWIIADFGRGFRRTSAYQLHIEQVEQIRMARERYLAGDTGAKEFPSFAAPGSSWKIEVNASEATATVRLDPVPAWAWDKEVVGPPADFYMLPLDGSVPWQFTRK